MTCYECPLYKEQKEQLVNEKNNILEIKSNTYCENCFRKIAGDKYLR